MFEDSLSIAKAQIRHRRFYPKAHDFESSLSYLCFDPLYTTKKDNSLK